MSSSVPGVTPPEPDPWLALEPASCALLTIDVQRDFLSDQPYGVPGTTEVLPQISRLVRAYRDAGRPVVHIVRLYAEDGSDADLVRRGLLASGVRLVAPGSPGSRLAEGLAPDGAAELDPDLLLSGAPQQLGPDEIVLYKPRWGAFYRTPLDAWLRDRGVTSLVVVGCNLPNCPRATLIEGSERDYRLAAVPEALSRTTPQALADLAALGVHLLTPEAAAALPA